MWIKILITQLTAAMTRQDKIEKAVFQLLVAKGFVSDDDLNNYVEQIKPDFEHHDQPTSDMFKKLNQSLRNMSLEIKSVRVQDSVDKNVWRFYHGVVNIEEDFVSKEYGNQFTPEELKFFSSLALKLLEIKYMSTDDVLYLKNKKHGADAQLDRLLERLKAQGWLALDDSSYWILGVRTYLELRSYLESMLQSGAEEDDPDVVELINRMPQNIVY